MIFGFSIAYFRFTREIDTTHRNHSFSPRPKYTSKPILQKLLCTVFIVTTLFLAFGGAAVEAQQAGTPARVGYLGAASYAANKSRVEAFRQGLREAGYIEGQNIVIDYRYADGKFARLPALAAELVRLDAAVIVSGGSAATGPAKKATATIPIVMTNDPDPVANGFVASLARPGGNVTGLATLSPAISGKRLEILNEIVPKLSRVAVFGSSTEPNDAQALKEVELTAKALGIELQYIDVRGSKDLDAGFADARNGRADALLVLSGARFVFQQKQIIELAAKNRLAAIYHRSEFVEAGGLMSYAARLTDLSRRAATYVDKILKGAKAADLPVEQPTKFELLMNLKAAKQIGLTIPPNVLARADRVIK